MLMIGDTMIGDHDFFYFFRRLVCKLKNQSRKLINFTLSNFVSAIYNLNKR